MRLVSISTADGPRAAVRVGSNYVDLNRYDPHIPRCLRQIFELGAPALDRVRTAARRAEPQPIFGRLAAPVARPEKVICIGLNYADHAAESGADIPSEPVVFSKFPTAVCGTGDPIRLPALSQKVDYEAELVVVIGTGGKQIPEHRAVDHIAGYTCGHDVSARDWQLQKPGGQWLLGKTFDTFAPTGPEIVTTDELDDPGNLGIRLRLNGQTMQDSNTRQLIFSIPKLVAYISNVCTLVPGDLIFTGTPPGVGSARKPPVYLRDGDRVEVDIQRIGVLDNPVVREA